MKTLGTPRHRHSFPGKMQHLALRSRGWLLPAYVLCFGPWSTVHPQNGARIAQSASADGVAAPRAMLRAHPGQEAAILVRDVAVPSHTSMELAATYYDPQRAGPAVLIFRNCDQPRSSVSAFARKLAARGMHVVAYDYRAGATPAGYTWQSSRMEDAGQVFRWLLSQPRVDRGGAGIIGGSCGSQLALEVTKAHVQQTKAVVVLSSASIDAATLALVANSPELAVFAGAATAERSDVNLEPLIKASSNPESRLAVIPAGHGTEMLRESGTMENAVIEWLAGRLSAAAAPTLPPAGAASADLRSGFILVANQMSSSATLIDLRTDSALTISVPQGPHEAVISPSGRTGIVTIYGGGGQVGNQLVVVDIATGRVRKTIALGQYARPHGANFLPGESHVVVTSETTQTIVLVNLVTGSVEAAVPTNAQGSHMVAVTADGKRAFTSNAGSGGVSEIDLATRTFVRSIAVGPRVEGIAVAPDGSTVWAGSNANGTVSVIDTRSGTIVETLTGLGLPYRLAMSTDGKLVLVCDAQGNQIHALDVAQRKVLWRLDGLHAPRGVNISADGKHAFVTLAGSENMVAIVDLEARKVLRKLPVGSAPDGVWYGPAPR